ncbi:hypothetical protein HZA98_04035 [Candidatus Woesearchaeota archaeon]|nr:hypothetical protein [Candidatus Woesearchaeota archaeon]
MKLEAITENIFHLLFPTKRKLCFALMRFQEHFESPAFKGKFFTREEYQQWYTQNSIEGKRTGQFTYYKDWNGFNFPSHILDPFYEGRFDPLMDEEGEVLKAFEKRKGALFYVIGTYNHGGQSILKHEIAHGLFHTNKEYQTEVLRFMESIEPQLKEKLKQKLLESGGYHPEVVIDETHAHLLADRDKLEEDWGIPDEETIPPHNQLEAIFKRYFPSQQ